MDETCTLLCSAFEPEVGGLLAELQAGEDGVFAGSIHGHSVLAKPVGIGLVDAGIGIAQLLAHHNNITRVVFLGTAGASPGAGLHLGSIVTSTRFTLCDTSTLTAQSYVPDIMPTHIETSPGFAPREAAALCVSPLGITKSDELAAHMETAYGPHVENLEVFSVARACAARGLPFQAVLGISNTVGSGGHAEWKANHKDVSLVIQQVVREMLG